MTTVFKDLRHRIEYAAFRSFEALVRALPLELASRWCGAGWRLIAPHLGRHQRALANLRMAFPDKAEAELERIARAMWDNLGRTFAEFFRIPEIVREGRIALENPQVFESLGRGGPIVMCSLHLGNWEIAPHAFAANEFRFSLVYQALTNPLVDRHVTLLRHAQFPAGLWPKSPRTAVKLLALARQGGCVALLADQRDGRGQPAPFFGRLASSTPFPAFVARSTGAPLCVCRVKRLDGVRFSASVERIEAPSTGDRHADVAEATRLIQEAFERIVRETPEQWMWAHRRWD